MKRIIITLCAALILTGILSAQNNDLIVVKAGTKLLDYFTVAERYLYSEFIPGRVIFKNGSQSDRNLNYNFIAGEIEFIQNNDTLSIANKKEIKSITVAQDTFYYDKGYIEQLNSGKVKVGLKQFIELKEIQNKDSYGTSSSGSATTSYGTLPSQGNFYKLTSNKDMIFKKTLNYYLFAPDGVFILFNKKSTMQLYPEKSDEIKAYLKSSKVDFNSMEDLLRFADFLSTL